MLPEYAIGNVVPWLAQSLLIAGIGALLPQIFRVRHPRTQVAFGHIVIALCLLFPLLQSGRRVVTLRFDGPITNPPARQALEFAPEPSPPLNRVSTASLPARPGTSPRHIPWRAVLLGVILAGAVIRLVWLCLGMYQVRGYRIASTPVYPVPASIQAAEALTGKVAVFCVSEHVPGPVLAGAVHPVVLLPASFAALTDEGQCGIACHELLHAARHDWLVTLLEELAGALLWFNPAVLWLLSDIRLAREQLIDAESVRLTEAPEPYIEALLSFASVGPSADLAPAPLFIRKHHLTQRMHSLLTEITMSRQRLVSSLLCMSSLLAATLWFAFLSFPITGRAQVRTIARSNLDFTATVAPLGTDPHEFATSGVQAMITPKDRAAALSMLEQARQNSDMFLPGTPPFELKVSFNASGNVTFTGPGEMTDTWVSARSWRWTATLAGYTQTRAGLNGNVFDDRKPVQVPMRIAMLRGAIFSPVRLNTSGSAIRKAAVTLNGQPATCFLLARAGLPASSARLWEETEYCVNDSTGLLEIYSEAPGTYALYSYGANLQFHGRSIPDRIAVYSGGSQVIDAQLSIRDAAPDPAQVAPTQEMISQGPVIPMVYAMRFPANIPSTASARVIQPVIVHASLDQQGKALEQEVSMASDPALVQTALDVVRNGHFRSDSSPQRDVYINVRFVPPVQ